MLINHEQRKIFLHNPKCAGTSVTAVLMDAGFTYVSSPEIFLPNGIVQRHSWFIPAEFSSYFSFCTVRHPYEVCRSHWRYASTTNPGYFPTFISWLEQIGPYIPRQAFYVRAVKQAYHLHELDFKLPHYNRSSASEYQLTSEERRLVWCMFREDFDLLAYDH